MEFDKLLLPEGYQFKCTQCGCCCHQKKGIFMGKPEKRILGNSEFIVPNDGFEKTRSFYRWKIQTGEEDRCPFLEAGNNCRVYGKRPFFCRKWPFIIDYVPPIGLFGTAVFCCGSGIGTKTDDSQIKSLLSYLTEQDWYKEWVKSEKAIFESTPFMNTVRKISLPRVADTGTGAVFWDYMSSLISSPALKNEPIRWRMWAVKQVWYLSFDFMAKSKPSHTLVEIGKENREWYVGTLSDTVKRFLPQVMSLLSKRKESIKYPPLNAGENLCVMEAETKMSKLEDKERAYYGYDKSAQELFEKYAKFYVRRHVHIPRIRSLLTHLPVAVNEIEQKIMITDGYAKTFAKQNEHEVVKKEDIMRAIRLRDKA